jgi:hypothetical protein
MILTSGETQTEFEFHVVGYQFADVLEEEYDANWLMVRICVKSGESEWTKTDPCLLTWEGHWLANWLADLEAGCEQQTEMSFLESNVVFQLVARDGTHVRLWVGFEAELTGAPEDERLGVLLEISEEELRKALSEWCWQLRMFPVRASRGRRCRPFNDERTGCVVCGTPDS